MKKEFVMILIFGFLTQHFMYATCSFKKYYLNSKKLKTQKNKKSFIVLSVIDTSRRPFVKKKSTFTSPSKDNHYPPCSL
ncbi:hypothetical protein KAH94_05730 [bacterium]|nr:hypothetical protein [bacterium]